MDIDVQFDGASFPIQVEDPFRLDLEGISSAIETFLAPRGLAASDLRLGELLPGMVRGICGCQNGCPADAQGFVRNGCGDYRLEYIEGGILTATLEKAAPAGAFVIRMFPEF